LNNEAAEFDPMDIAENCQLKKSHVAFFSPEEDFSTNPSLSCIIEALLTLGAEVDIFMGASRKCPPMEYDLRIYPFPMRLRKWYGGIKKSLGNWERYVHGRKAHQMLKSQKYDLVFGVNPEGVIAALDYYRKWNTPFVYLSYEMLFKDELYEKARLCLKREEIEASQFAHLVIMQDPRRGYLLSQENNVSKKKMFWLPVSPKMEGSGCKSDYLRKTYHIPDEKWVVLHSGSFEKWTYAEELLQNTQNWSDNVVLVIHCKQKGGKRRRNIKKILNKDKHSNIIFSTTPLERSAYEQMVSSADIGLCLYKEVAGDPFLQKNIRHIGLSSGKFAYYTKFGLPVISVRSKTYTELAKHYNFGEDLEQFSELPGAMHRIMADYDRYSRESKSLFREKLVFDLYCTPLIEKLSTIHG
jgi:hypothetical protein